MSKKFWTYWCVWMLLDLVTAVLMELYTDEGYYWMWSQHMDWGYYDHPPMVAAWIWLSSHLWPLGGGLSVRLVTVLMHGVTLWLMAKITFGTQREHPAERSLAREEDVFFLVAGSLVMFTVAGFLTTPDAPMLLFTSAFFLCLERYFKSPALKEEREKWLWAIGIGVCLALMTYSKYMVVPVLGLVVVANPKLMKDVKMWVALLVAGILILPHILWQVKMGFPSLQFHLVARSDPFEWGYLLDYIPNQLIVFNPILLVLGVILSVKILWGKNKSEDAFERTMAWQILGFEAFFALMTFRGHVEPHWTMTCSIAIVVVGGRWMIDRLRQLDRPADYLTADAVRPAAPVRFVYWGLVVIVGLIMVARVVLWANILPIQTGLGSKKVRYESMKELSEGRPVVFAGSFQWTSMYQWFEHEPAILVHDLRHYRHTQYEFWHLEMPYQGKPVCVLEPMPGAMPVQTPTDELYKRLIERFQATDGIEIRPVEPERRKTAMLKEDGLEIEVEVENPYGVDFEWRHSEMPVQLCIAGLVDNEWQVVWNVQRLGREDVIHAGGKAVYRISANAPWFKKEQKICIGLHNGIVLTKNSEWITLD